MSSADSLLEGLRASYAKIAEVEAVAAQHPGDRFVMLSLNSVKAHTKELEDEWLEECRIRQVEVCRYRLISRAQTYVASAFAKSLIEFQELFSQIYDAKKNGPKRRARLSGDVLSDTTFGMAYTFPGSLGVVLTVEDELSLIGGKFDDTINSFHDIAGIDDEFDVRDAATSLGDAVVKKIYDWSFSNYFSGFSVDIVWSGKDGIKSGRLIDRNSFGKIVDIIDRTSDVERHSIKVMGSLVAIDVQKKRFRLVVPDGDDFPGELSEEFDTSKQWSVNRTYMAEIAVETVTRYATQKTEVVYRLKSLDPDI